MLDSLKSLLEDQVKDLYNAENQLTKALPKMAKKADNATLREAFEKHLVETQQHIERLDEIAQLLEVKPSGKVCKAMKGLIEEGKEVLDETGQSPVIDAALIAAAQRVEHYEIAAYTEAHAIAEQLGESKIAKLFRVTLDEERGASEKLSAVGSQEVLPATSSMESEDSAPAKSGPKSSRTSHH